MSSFNIKRVLIGSPFPTSSDIHERLDKIRGLAIFASDPISSNAYATEAIMGVLVLLGAGALRLTMPIALAVAGLVLFVVFSYIQTILHYPKGGGAYMVTKDNLGTVPSLFAAAALLIDYILTVSVSVSAGIRAVTSAFPETHDYRILLALIAIAILTWLNLRGIRESGSIFALPTYAFIGGVMVVILLGMARQMGLFGLAPPVVPTHTALETASDMTQFFIVWTLLRAFAAGCTALTGIEAISDGVRAFKPPEAKNAAQTMVAMGVIAMTLFLGITFVSTQLDLVPHIGGEGESILSQLTRAVSGTGILYYWVQFFTMMILILAANTGFQDFPRVSSFLANDGFLPRWMQNRGDRLVFSSGILTLALLSSLIVIAFRADEIMMLPLYALGVMLGFTLSQFSMARLMGRVGELEPGETLETKVTSVEYESGWRWKRWVSLIGGSVTFVVLIILMTTKFTEGAWIVVAMIPLLVLLFLAIHRHYEHVSESLTTRNLTMDDFREIADVVIVPVGDIHRGTLRALRYARKFSDNVQAVSVCTSDEMQERIVRRWERFPHITADIELVCVDYDYRDILTPIVDYIEHVNHTVYPEQIITVVIPEFIPEHPIAQALHNQTANILRYRLRHHEDIAIIDVPYHIHSEMDAATHVEEAKASAEWVARAMETEELITVIPAADDPADDDPADDKPVADANQGEGDSQ